MAAFFDSPVDVVVCGKTVAIMFEAEGLDKYDIAVAVVS